jgi:tetratricopeptide (TPR) repeat protein/transcriptional regulator with XRE-family HTH domain
MTPDHEPGESASGAPEEVEPGRFGPLLRRHRIAARLTQEQLAERAGLSPRSLRDIERGHVRSPRLETVRLLAAALQLPGGEAAQFEALSRADYWAARTDNPPPDLSAGLAAEPEPAASAGDRPVPAQLPPDVASFTGREPVLRELNQLLSPGGGRPTAVVIAALTGMAGVGKTALALHWAHRVRHRFPDGQLYANLRGYDTSPPLRPIEVVARFLHALGVKAEAVPVDLEEAAALYRSLVADRRMLVVLDNAGHPDQVRALLPGTSGSLVLVTSREDLAGLVARDGATRVGVDALSPDEATTLLGRLLGPERVARETAAAAELAQLCAYLPLALRIAAANLSDRGSYGLDGYVAELRGGDRLDALAAPSDEQAAVRGAFDLSYAALPADAQRLFRLVGLAPGPDVPVAAAAAMSGLDEPTVARLLHRLSAAHLLESVGPGRYACHDLLREYAAARAERDDGPAETEAAVTRLLDWYLHSTAAAALLLYAQIVRLPVPDPPPGLAAPGFTDPAGASEWLAAERPNLIMAARHAAASGRHRTAWLLTDAMRGYLWQSRYTVDWQELVTAGLAAAEASGDLREQAAMQISRGCMWQCAEQFPQALADFETAARLAERAGWAEGHAASLGNVATARQEMWDVPAAAEAYAEALAVHERMGWRNGRAISLGNLGQALELLGRLDEASDLLYEAVTAVREVNAPAFEANVLAELGTVEHYRGRLDEAEELFEQALRVSRETGNRYSEAAALHGQAEIRLTRGQLAEARMAAHECQVLNREIGKAWAQADLLSLLGSVHLSLGSLDWAAAHEQQAVTAARDARCDYAETRALVGLAAAHRARGRYADAAECAGQGRTIAAAGGYRVVEGRALAELAEVRLATGAAAEAAELATAAVDLQRGTGHRIAEADALVVLGGAAQAAGDREAARAHWTEALRIFAGCGASRAAQVRLLLAPEQPDHTSEPHPGTAGEVTGA